MLFFAGTAALPRSANSFLTASCFIARFARDCHKDEFPAVSARGKAGERGPGGDGREGAGKGGRGTRQTAEKEKTHIKENGAHSTSVNIQ